jgi:hypothetical protein
MKTLSLPPNFDPEGGGSYSKMSAKKRTAMRRIKTPPSPPPTGSELTAKAYQLSKIVLKFNHYVCVYMYLTPLSRILFGKVVS